MTPAPDSRTRPAAREDVVLTPTEPAAVCVLWIVVSGALPVWIWVETGDWAVFAQLMIWLFAMAVTARPRPSRSTAAARPSSPSASSSPSAPTPAASASRGASKRPASTSPWRSSRPPSPAPPTSGSADDNIIERLGVRGTRGDRFARQPRGPSRLGDAIERQLEAIVGAQQPGRAAGAPPGEQRRAPGGSTRSVA